MNSFLLVGTISDDVDRRTASDIPRRSPAGSLRLRGADPSQPRWKASNSFAFWMKKPGLAWNQPDSEPKHPLTHIAIHSPVSNTLHTLNVKHDSKAQNASI